MRQIPSHEVLLAGGIRCAPKLVDAPGFQAHVLKHPMGVNAVRRSLSVDRWNAEGWDASSPPVVDAKARSELAGRIVAIGDAHQRCTVPELRGKVGTEAEPECYRCQDPLIAGCGRVLKDVGDRYAAVTEATIAALGDGITLRREVVSKRLMTLVRTPSVWADLVVMSVGKSGRANGWVVRLNRGDGVRVELTLGAGDRAQWRTTYREPKVGQPFGAVSFLLEAPTPDRALSLSDVYAVPRGWWERHGS